MSTRAAKEPGPVNGLRNSPRRTRARLDTLVRVRRELTRIYTSARDGERDVSDASKLGNLLGLLGRMIEGGELERRIEALEVAQVSRLRQWVRRLEERAAGGNVGRRICEVLEQARLRARRAGRGEHVAPPKPRPSRAELERDVTAGGWRATVAAARLRVLDLPGASP